MMILRTLAGVSRSEPRKWALCCPECHGETIELRDGMYRCAAPGCWGERSRLADLERRKASA